MDVDELIKRATADLEEAEAQLRAAEGRVKELQTIRDGLRFALQRYGDVEPAPTVAPEAPASVPPGIAAGEVSQTDLVFNVLAGFDRPAKSKEVHAKVLAAGREYNFEQVRGALGYLLRKKRIKRVGTALWEVPANSPSQEGFTPAADTAGVSTAGENGQSLQADALTRAGLFPQPAG